ncbi:MAG: DUF1287 domain-containing protein [Verrucomicrobiae bacterium]|nr:DUF1287 domain-containing protein [Verrucomicrobiae bacterium]
MTPGKILLLAAFCLSGAAALSSGVAEQNAGLVRAAREQIGVTLSYDPAYTRLKYPGGDVAPETGVCTDVVIRAFRGVGLDLQVLVHEDMKSHFKKYPQLWKLPRPDPNIDHRRVPNLMTYFERQGKRLPPSRDPAAYRAGDVVAWKLPGGLLHIGIVSDGIVPGTQRPRVIHNIGSGAREEDVLFAYEIIGHYRWLP